jgi:tetratricopeptide (TPR) repeat protein
MFKRDKEKKSRKKQLKPGFVKGVASNESMSTKKKALIVGVVVVVAFAAGIGFTLYRNHNQGSDQEAVLREFSTLEDETYNLQSTGKTDEAIQIWKDYLATGPQPEFEAAGMVRIGTLLMNVDKPQEALEWFQKANALGETQGSVVGIAYAATVLGNKNLAIEYYQKAVEMEKKFQAEAGPTNDDYLQSQTNQQGYEVKIQELKAQ